MMFQITLSVQSGDQSECSQKWEKGLNETYTNVQVLVSLAKKMGQSDVQKQCCVARTG